MFYIWLAMRFLTSGRRLLNLPSLMSLLGMTLGVASLTVAMGVVSGFEKALKNSITDVYGHIMVLHRGNGAPDFDRVLTRIRNVAPEVSGVTPFVSYEGVMTRPGQLAGVVVQGVDPSSVETVLSLRKRIIRGQFAFGEKAGVPMAMVGKSLANKFNLSLGQEFKVVQPGDAAPGTGKSEFVPRVETYRLAGVLDLGKIEYDERYVLTDIKSIQTFLKIGDRLSGFRLQVRDFNESTRIAGVIGDSLGPDFWTSDWKEVNRNLLEAIELEKPVIFLVILVMVVAASFNIAANLFVLVMQKYSDMSVLRAIGFSPRDIMKTYVFQGLFFGGLGTFFGLILGLVLCALFVELQKFVVLLPVETYRIDSVGIDLRWTDLGMIVGVSIAICLMATLVPALRGARLNPIEGLRYE